MPANKCAACGGRVVEADTVWVEPDGAAGTSDTAKPYHVGCAPEQPEGTECD